MSESHDEPRFTWADCRTRKAVVDEDSDLGARISTFLGGHLDPAMRELCTERLPEFEEVITGRRIPGLTYLNAIEQLTGVDCGPFCDEVVEQENEMSLAHRYAYIEVAAIVRVRAPLEHVRNAYAHHLDWPRPEELQARLEEATDLWDFIVEDNFTVKLGKPSVEINLEVEPEGGET